MERKREHPQTHRPQGRRPDANSGWGGRGAHVFKVDSFAKKKTAANPGDQTLHLNGAENDIKSAWAL